MAKKEIKRRSQVRAGAHVAPMTAKKVVKRRRLKKQNKTGLIIALLVAISLLLSTRSAYSSIITKT